MKVLYVGIIMYCVFELNVLMSVYKVMFIKYGISVDKFVKDYINLNMFI